MSVDPRDGEFVAPPGTAAERLDRRLRTFRPALSWGQIRDLIRRGKVAIDGVVVTDEAAAVRGGARVVLAMGARRVAASAAAAMPVLSPDAIAFSDRQVVVVRKPAGLATVPWQDATDALDRRLAATLGAPVRVVHRLDRDTSGLLMFARTAEAEGRLTHQLRRHTVHRRYLAIAHGEVAAATIRSWLAEDRGDGLRGSVANPRVGKEAITHVEPLERLSGATLVACRLETGRTHQIRIHLAEAGHMLLGERGYVRDHRGPMLPAPRILLHAAELGFEHPTTGQPMCFSEPMPADMLAVLAALRC
ncbi:MAG: RluA family pseudouridine synthase [Planctomycetes bacterium]|nr:RluA family pseudouridine synthase [Planctomycetota bacterium]